MANPFRHMGQWYWTDAEHLVHGPYRDERTAMYALLDHESPPQTIMQQLARHWMKFKGTFRDTRRES